ncbi:MAG: 1-acyl-sn-glycerol-3-phosphate acyltransferase [Coprococcus sp.]|nr:1-acyl-sn-glycerol-3-phosphate acyltransferase [Coprococcus sp.]
MRTFITVLFAVLGIILCLPYHLYLHILAKKNPEKAYKKAFKLVKGFFGAVMFLAGCKRTIIGRDKIPEDTPVMFVGNHRSYFDILSCHNAIGFPVGFMSKEEIKKIPLLHLYMDDIGCTYLDRSDIKKGFEVIGETAEIIKNGHSMMIFPEGTRNKGDELLEFKDGSYKIAQKAGCLIIPVSICGTDNIMEANKHNMIHSHKVIIEFCDPININGLTPKERKAVLETIPGIIQETRLKNLPLATKK